MTVQRYRWLETLVTDRWDGFLKGIEKEGLRVDANGFIAQTPHPAALGSTLTHPWITTDYSEALLELITPVCTSTTEVLDWLGNIHRFVHQHLGDEVMWAPSMPCRLEGDASIPIAYYGTSNLGRLKHAYRQGLAVRYGRIMQSIAGVHYNFSLPDSFWQRWQQLQGDVQALQDFKSQQYFWLIRNFRRRSWLLMLLFGASPVLDASFVAGRPHALSEWCPGTLQGAQSTSLRMGDLGYHNNAQSSLDICFNRLDNYTRTLDRAIHTPWPAYEQIGVERDGQRIQLNTNVLQIENEYYSPIRPKRTTHAGEKPLQALRARGVEYIEVRCLDLNPFQPLGVEADQLDFLDIFLLSCLVDDSPLIDGAECAVVDTNFRLAVAHGRDPALALQVAEHRVGARALVADVFETLQVTASVLDSTRGDQHYQSVLKRLAQRLYEPDASLSASVLRDMQASGEGHVAWGLRKSREHQASLQTSPLASGLVTQMQDAVARSLQDTLALEADATTPFETFLARYLMS